MVINPFVAFNGVVSEEALSKLIKWWVISECMILQAQCLNQEDAKRYTQCANNATAECKFTTSDIKVKFFFNNDKNKKKDPILDGIQDLLIVNLQSKINFLFSNYISDLTDLSDTGKNITDSAMPELLEESKKIIGGDS